AVRRDLTAAGRATEEATRLRAPRSLRGFPGLLRGGGVGDERTARQLLQRECRAERPGRDQAGGDRASQPPQAVAGTGERASSEALTAAERAVQAMGGDGIEPPTSCL